jgi:large subunit ribosomal protein L3
MTQIFDADGRFIRLQFLSTGPLTVTQVKSKEKDGYVAVQVGFGERKRKEY